MAPAPRRLRLGVAGLGRAFTLMLPTLAAHPSIQLVAAAEPRAAARARFAAEFGARAHESVEQLCCDDEVEAIYIATPHQHHAAHAIAAACAGKHILVEKPLAVTLDEGLAMAEAAAAAGITMVVGPSHGFDAPVALARRIVASGELGRVRMVTALNYTDFLYRPRRPEELATAQGGGVAFSQASHQVDIVRLLAGGRIASVRAATGAWDPARPTEGAYGALLTFADGAFASLAYSGYGHYDSDELMGNVSELGRDKGEPAHGAARRSLAAWPEPADEAAAKQARSYGGAGHRAPSTTAPWHEHFGFIVVSCERGDLRPTPRGVEVYTGDGQRHMPLAPPGVPRREAIDELCAAVFDAKPPLHGARWGLATLEACLALLESARSGRDVALRHQVAVGDN